MLTCYRRRQKSKVFEGRTPLKFYSLVITGKHINTKPLFQHDKNQSYKACGVDRVHYYIKVQLESKAPSIRYRNTDLAG